MWFLKILQWIDSLFEPFIRADITRNNEPIPMPPIEPKPPVESTPVSPMAPTPPAPAHPLLQQFCLAIRDYEGAPGDRNYKNNNPGNCRYSSVGYLPLYGHVGKDKDNFAIFRDYATGWLYLNNLIKSKVQENPHQSILTFMESYAPTGDGNNPKLYATFIAKRLGVDITYPMVKIVA